MVVLVAFFLVVAVVALPLLLLPTGKPPKPPPGPPKPTKRKQKPKQHNRNYCFGILQKKSPPGSSSEVWRLEIVLKNIPNDF